jgi:hypothetical protein
MIPDRNRRGGLRLSAEDFGDGSVAVVEDAVDGAVDKVGQLFYY